MKEYMRPFHLKSSVCAYNRMKPLSIPPMIILVLPIPQLVKKNILIPGWDAREHAVNTFRLWHR